VLSWLKTENLCLLDRHELAGGILAGSFNFSNKKSKKQLCNFLIESLKDIIRMSKFYFIAK